MSTEVATFEPRALVPQPSESQATMAMIERLIRDESISIDRIERMIALKERVDEQNRKAEFAAALHAVQGKHLRVHKSKQGKNSKYAPLEEIDEKLTPILQENGLSVSFDCPEISDAGMMRFIMWVYHRNGHVEPRTMPMPVDDIGTNSQGKALRPRIQDHGSTVSYSRRALLKMTFNVVETDEDDDGEGGERLDPITQDQIDTIKSKSEEYGFKPADQSRLIRFAARLQGKQNILLTEIRQCDLAAVFSVIEEMRR